MPGISLPRRSALARTAGVITVTGGLTQFPAARAQSTYPSRPVRVVVGFTAGGFTDLVARAVMQPLSERLKQSFVVENKPGAGANIATAEVIRAAPDGYTLIINTVGPMAINPTLYRKLPHDPINDLAPVVLLCDGPNVLVVNPAMGVKSFEAFVERLKAQPGRLTYGSTGVGTAAHLSSFMLSQRIGSSAIHVPYKGAEALRDLLAGQIDFMCATVPSVISLIRAQRPVPLARPRPPTHRPAQTPPQRSPPESCQTPTVRTAR